MSSNQPFTGHSRQRRTTRMVRAADKLAHGLIVGGGLGTIVAVLLVSVFLIWVVLPLFLPSTLTPLAEVKPPWTAPTWRLGVDEHQLAGWELSEGGKLRLFRLDPGYEGQIFAERQLTESNGPTVTAFAQVGDQVALGFADGTLKFGSVSFRTSFLEPQNVDAKLRELKVGEVRADSEGLVTRTAEGQLRRQLLTVDLGAKASIAGDRPVVAIDFSHRATGLLCCAQVADGSLHVGTFKSIRNLETDEVTYRSRWVDLPYPPDTVNSAPRYLRLSGAGDNAFAVWPDGRLLRFDLRDPANPQLAEELNVLAEPNRQVTAVEFTIGKSTLVVGDSAGGIRGWFRVNRPTAATTDESQFVAAHELPATGSAVTALAASSRTRMIAAGYEDGGVRVFYLTTDSLLVEHMSAGNAAVANMVMAPKDDGLLSLSSETLSHWRLNAPHPEVSLAALFRPVWYEGSDSPTHVWQSSSGTDDFEPKLGLAPLVFGTVKATFYSLLIAVPLALLAAIYTSEFLRRGTRAKIKPAIELMASLPSVVLGFIAALVLAPLVEDMICGLLAAAISAPLALLLGAFLWQLLPSSARVEWAQARFACMCVLLPLGVVAGLSWGPWLEGWLFEGDVKAWLQGGVGSALGGWWALLLPWMAAGSAWLLGIWVNPWLRGLFAGRPPFQAALADLGKFLFAFGATLVAAGSVAWLLSVAGFDPRGSLLDTYEQRNALVVGFVMGFAIIPIIYTIAEDALSSVPEHLRSASLGAGATEWQTAVRIVVPTAMSGLFSAVMIGLGRAVGETMIVLMAAGNTPVMSWNIFNGFRTLSANIAVELPEAVRDSTHYRTLFLAALVLFALTFVLNTAAETIRQRFRKRAFQL